MSVIRAVTFPMAPRSRFERHVHDDHQLAWAANGVLTVAADAGTWVLPPSRALWIPAGVPHETIASERSTMRTLYLEADTCPIQWKSPRPVVATALLVALIEHLEDNGLDPQHRVRAEQLTFDLLEPVEVATIQVTMPTDERALDVARALVSNPADTRNLADWGHETGVSGRTLTRAFLADTGIPFARWRTSVLLQAAIPLLAAGEPVATVAGYVGYETPSAFIAAFRRHTGVTLAPTSESPISERPSRL
ncbi:MAG: helix-turn-helix transcriptional regulator, partial [Solirubrobacterales bacterium]|nr:helix-turn-helix transcriptional regulator [Solirubrobacterales bacterium]